MGERKSSEELLKLAKKHNTDRIWSWSRYHTYKQDPYGYFLKYIKKEKETKFNIYTVSGGHCHDILENFYLGKIKYKNMIDEYEQSLYEMNLAEFKYDRNNEEKNEKIAKNYESNIKLFFQNYQPIKNKTICEQFIVIKVGKYLFHGYIDFVHKDNDKYIVEDFKTSTIYTGKKIDSEKGQLVLYAEALRQLGVPIENIIIRWNFLKYCTVEYETFTKDKETKQYKMGSTNQLRNDIFNKTILNNISKRLEQAGYDELQIEDCLQTCQENNSFDYLPEDIKSKYNIKDCYVEIPLSEDIINELLEDMIKTLDEIYLKEEEYKLNDDDTIFWTEIDKTNEYYFSTLCGYGKDVHKPYKEYLDSLELFIKDSNDNKEDDNLDWLNDL